MININLFGGPGTGKSTTAAGIFHEMKKAGYKVEYIQEFVKDLSYSNDSTRLSDQILIFGEQHHRLLRVRDSVDFVIHDSPIIMGLVYASTGKHVPLKELNDLVFATFNSYKNINIFLTRSDEHPYQTYGRHQGFAEAKQKDNEIRELLMDNSIPYYPVVADRFAVDNIIKIIEVEKEDTPWNE